MKRCVILLSLLLLSGCAADMGHSDIQTEAVSDTAPQTELTSATTAVSPQTTTVNTEAPSTEDTTSEAPAAPPEEERGEPITIPSVDDILCDYDRVISAGQEGLTMEETVALLMCRNAVAFDVHQFNCFDFISRPESLDFSSGEPLICELGSEVFGCTEDIRRLFSATYTASLAEELMLRNGAPAFWDNESGRICIDLSQGGGTWCTQPFSTATEIQLCYTSDRYCEFVWHYTQPILDEDNEIRAYPCEMLCAAVKENGEWRLAMMVFDNPEISAEGLREVYESRSAE